MAKGRNSQIEPESLLPDLTKHGFNEAEFLGILNTASTLSVLGKTGFIEAVFFSPKARHLFYLNRQHFCPFSEFYILGNYVAVSLKTSLMNALYADVARGGVHNGI